MTTNKKATTKKATTKKAPALPQNKSFTLSTFTKAVNRLTNSQLEITAMVKYIADQAIKHGSVKAADLLLESPAATTKSGKPSALGAKIKGYILANIEGIKAPNKEKVNWHLGKKGKAGVKLKDGAFKLDFIEWQAQENPKAKPKPATDKAITKSILALVEKLDNGIESGSMADLEAMVKAAEALHTAAKVAYSLTQTSEVDSEAVETLATVKPTGKEKKAGKVAAAI